MHLEGKSEFHDSFHLKHILIRREIASICDLAVPVGENSVRNAGITSALQLISISRSSTSLKSSESSAPFSSALPEKYSPLRVL